LLNSKNVLDLASIDEAVNNVFKRFTTLDHVNDKHLLVVLLVIWDLILKLLPFITNLDHELLIILDLNWVLVSTDKEGVLFNPYNRDGQVVGLDIKLDHLINLVVLSLLEWNWSLLEQLLTLLLEILLCQTKGVKTFESIVWVWNLVNSCLLHSISICQSALVA